MEEFPPLLESVGGKQDAAPAMGAFTGDVHQGALRPPMLLRKEEFVLGVPPPSSPERSAAIDTATSGEC